MIIKLGILKIQVKFVSITLNIPKGYQFWVNAVRIVKVMNNPYFFSQHFVWNTIRIEYSQQRNVQSWRFQEFFLISFRALSEPLKLSTFKSCINIKTYHLRSFVVTSHIHDVFQFMQKNKSIQTKLKAKNTSNIKK